MAHNSVAVAAGSRLTRDSAAVAALHGTPAAGPPPTADAEKRRWSVALCVAVLLVLAVGLRCVGLDRWPGVNGDEAWYGAQVQAMLHGQDFEMRTPSGLPLNPFFFGPLLLFHAVHPEPWLPALRLPALAAGLLLVVLSYPLLSRTLGRPAAWLATLFIACLPVHIAYARFGWDASQSPLACLVVLYFALRGRWLSTVLALLAAVVVHPTNLFLIPVIAGVWVGARWEREGPGSAGVRRVAGLLAAVVSVGLGTLWLLKSRQPALETVWERLTSLPDWPWVPKEYGRLLSGATVEEFVAGPLPDGALRMHDAVFFLGVIFLVPWGLWQLYRRRDGRGLGLVVGAMLSLAGLYLVAGHQPLTPHWERYAMFLTVPSCAAAAVLLAATGGSLRARRRQGLAACGVAAMLLAGTAAYYVRPLWTAGESHRAFRTGPVEPKLAAFQRIGEAVGADEPVTIVAEDWWCYQPLRYLAAGRDRWRVIPVEGRSDWRSVADLAPAPGPVFLVGFVGGAFEQGFDSRSADVGVEGPWVIDDAAGRPLLLVWRQRAARE